MGLYDAEFREMKRRFGDVYRRTVYGHINFIDTQDDSVQAMQRRGEQARNEETDGNRGFFRGMLIGIVLLLALSGCTVHTHTWEGAPPQTVVVHRPIVVQRPVVVHQRPRVVYSRHWSTKRVARTPARPRRRGYRNR